MTAVIYYVSPNKRRFYLNHSSLKSKLDTLVFRSVPVIFATKLLRLTSGILTLNSSSESITPVPHA